MALSRRDFLRGGVAGSAAAAAVGLGLDLKPSRPTPSRYGSRPPRWSQRVSVLRVGCAQLVYVQDNKIQQIEGNPDCPHTLGPMSQGSGDLPAFHQRDPADQGFVRAPASDKWEEKPLDWMMDRIAELTKKTREAGFIEKENGVTVNRCDSIASLGSACTDNEECYLQAKLFRSLGIVYFEHQARV